jgi:hypothetical protein
MEFIFNNYKTKQLSSVQREMGSLPSVSLQSLPGIPVYNTIHIRTIIAGKFTHVAVSAYGRSVTISTMIDFKAGF